MRYDLAEHWRVGHRRHHSDGPARIGEGQTDDLLRVVVTHNGIPSDNDLELSQWNLLFEESSGDPLSSTEANNLIENLYVYYSADGTWGKSAPLSAGAARA